MGEGDASTPEPLRLIRFPEHVAREAIERGQVLNLRPINPSAGGHPLGETYDAAAWQRPGTRRGLLYCVLTNADVEDRAATEELLATLRSPTPTASSPDSGTDPATTG